MTALRAGLCLLVMLCVLALGGVRVWTQSAVEIGAALLFVWWAVLVYFARDARIQWSPLNWPLLGFIGIGLLQLLFRGTSYAFLTRLELLKLAAYFLFFFLLAQAFRTRGDLSFLAWFLILFCFAVSLLAIIQHFTTQEMFWTISLGVDADPWGPYVNRNDFAGFVELTIPVGLALMAFRGIRRDVFPLVTLLTLVPLSALVLSSSRGGIVGFALEVAILALLLRKQRSLNGGRVAAVAMVAVAALLLISWIGARNAIQRFSIVGGDTSVSRRISMARGAAHIFFDHPIVGSGLGTLVTVFPRYETAYDAKIVEHVHDDYIETLAEAGLLGAACGAWFLFLLYRKGRRNYTAEQGHFSRGLHAAGILAVSALLLHSFVDFNLRIPGNALLFLMQVYLLTCPPLPSQTPRQANSRAEGAVAV